MPVIRRLLTIFAFALQTGAAAAQAPVLDYDLVITGGRVIDGSGNPWFSADVAIRDGRIVAVGEVDRRAARATIDASGKIVAPGFIDIHSHADDNDAGEHGLRSSDARRRSGPSVVAQGITTVTVNPDGFQPAMSISAQKRELETKGVGPNVILMVGHNRVRAQALGDDFRRKATSVEISRMRALVRQGLAEGAFGLTTGLEYDTAIYSDTDELIELARELPPVHGAFIVHLRSQGAVPMWWLPSRDPPDVMDFTAAIAETIRVGEASGATVVATHIKARGVDYWGSAQRVVSMIEQARARGVSIYSDQYTYVTSASDGQLLLVPEWALDAKGEDIDYGARLESLLQNPKRAAAMRRDVEFTIGDRGGASNIRVMETPDAALVGRSLADIAAQWKLSTVEAAIRLQLTGDRKRRGGARLRSFSMAESDVEEFMRQPWNATSTDGEISMPGDGNVHTRNYGTYVRKIERYALERHAITLEQAIRSSTSLPAQILGLRDRGYVRAGQVADLVVLDLARLHERGTFEDPNQFPDGVDLVLVGGVAVVTGGKLTGALAGRVLAPAH